MRTHGHLSKWNDERGFGFLSTVQGDEEVFVHISAFPRDGTRPRVGELVSFEVETGDKGKPRAVRVQRPGGGQGRANRQPSRQPPGLLGWAAVVVILVGLAAMGYRYAARDVDPSVPAPELPPPDGAFVAQPEIAPEFRCDGRTQCSQMTSCAEAEFFLRHCPNVRMDGNGDGEPCEQQWCD